MILCLNLNAAIDKTIVVASFEAGCIHRPESVISLAGGKGCNVARALKTLGETPVVTGWVGGFAGRFIEADLRREAIQTDLVLTDSESRTCTSILDRATGALTEIYEAGEAVPAEKIEELTSRLRAVIHNFQAVTLSGSLPPGVPADFYAAIVELAAQAGVPAFLDTGGEALRHGVEARPFIVKPNEAEARSLLGLKPGESFDAAQAAAEISIRYGTKALLSLGPRGAVAAQGREVFRVKLPIVEAVSAVGSGDCMLAGFVHGVVLGLSFDESIRCGAAAGTANTLTIGAGRFRMNDFDALRGQIQISKNSAAG